MNLKHPPCMYVFIHQKIISKSEEERLERILDRQFLKRYLACYFKIPKPVVKRLIEELSEMGFIEEIDKFKIRVN